MKKHAAGLIGTFVLVFGGCGAALLAGNHIGFAGVAFAFGFSLLAMAYAIGPTSGCHINPAVTFGLLLSGKFEAKHVPGYVIAQIAGRDHRRGRPPDHSRGNQCRLRSFHFGIRG